MKKYTQKQIKELKTNNVADNILNRKFKEHGPRMVLLTDITYIPYNNTRCYLSVILDAFTKEVLSYVIIIGVALLIKEFVFTLIIVITFAIEIGQKVSNTGTMDFADIAFGVVGFLYMYIIFALLRGIWHGIKKLLEKRQK